MSKLKNVKLDSLKKALVGLGFSQKDSSTGHLLFSHAKTGAVVSIPNKKNDVPAIYVNTAARQVANSGIATVEKFERALRSGSQKSAANKSEQHDSGGA